MDNFGPAPDDIALQIAAHSVISLDVFDTLILRAVSAPADVFALVKLTLMTRPEALANSATLDVFPALRRKAERLARVSKQKSQGTTEVTFDEIYQQLAVLSGTDPEWLATLK